MTHHPSERLQIQPGRLGEFHGLACRSVGGERQHVAGQLHSGARARLASVDDDRRPVFERRLDPLVDLAVGAHHGRELAFRGSGRAATDGRVDDVNALLFEFAGKFGCRRVADGRVDRDDR